MTASHPAGRDPDLYRAVQDIRAGYWMQMRQVLARTGYWAQWTSRTQVLGVAAAETNTVELWLEEEPDSLAAQVMYARVATERVLRAHRKRTATSPGQARRLEKLAEGAWQASSRAAALHPGDPVPWNCFIALTETDAIGRHPQHRVPPPQPEHLLPPGPWGLLREAHRRDPFNREAWHRMSQALQSRPGPAGRRAVATDFARWTVSLAPADSPLLLLPVYARVQENRERRDSGEGAVNLLWSRDDITRAVTRAFTGWFRNCDPATSSQLDLNHLAYALVRGGFPHWAAQVFEAIGVFATRDPWQYHAQHPHQWQETFETDRDACLKSHAPHVEERRP